MNPKTPTQDGQPANQLSRQPVIQGQPVEQQASQRQPVNQFVQPTAGTPVFNSRNIEALSFSAQNQNYFTNVKKPREPIMSKVEPDQIVKKHKNEILVAGILIVALIVVMIFLAVS